MNFNNVSFLIYVAVVASMLWAMPATRARRNVLLVTSYIFYSTWSPLYLLLLLGVAVTAQRVASWAVQAPPTVRAKRAYLGVAVLVAILALFRSSIVLVPIRDVWVRTTGLPLDNSVPLGLSFYVFEAISYLIEVAKGREKTYGFWEFQLFIAFFPHLLSGPIMRAKEMIPQFVGGAALRPRDVGDGVWYITSGLFLKVVFADELAAKVDPWFVASPSAMHAGDVVAIGMGFALQMYCDFAGYSRIAIGCGLLCGVRLIENFNYPFNAVSPSDFWNRWHISLSRWIRDYVFLPFVGTRRTLARMCLAAMISMVLVGLWHGFGIKFLVWGLFHGSVISGYHVYRHTIAPAIGPATSKSVVYEKARAVVGWAVTALALFPGWLLFRCPDLGAAVGMLRALGRPRGHSVEGSTYLHVTTVFVAVVAYPFANRTVAVIKKRIETARVGRLVVDVAIGVGLAGMISITMIYFGTSRSFVYFQF